MKFYCHETAMPRKSLPKLAQAATFSSGLLLALATLLPAGCVGPEPTPNATSGPAATHAPAETPPSYDEPHGLLLAYGDHVGEFGGIHYEGGDPRGTMHFYMTEGNFDPALIPDARERFDRFYRHIPGQKIVVHKARYPWSRLEEWQSRLSGVLFGDSSLGISGGGLSELDRLIFYGAIPKRGNRERIEAVAAASGVPRDAVRVDIGCDGIPDGHLTEEVSPGFRSIFAYSVEAQSQARYGETVNLKLIIRNRTSEPAHIYGGTNSFGFVVSNQEGESIWYWECGRVYTMELQSQWVSPDKPLEFTGHWEQIDIKGHPVPPGIYKITGTFRMDYPERLVTDPVTIEILPP